MNGTVSTIMMCLLSITTMLIITATFCQLIDTIEVNSYLSKDDRMPTAMSRLRDGNLSRSALDWQHTHCWRGRIVPHDRVQFDILVTGSGYSATGYFAKTLTAAGYSIGHKR